MSIDRRVWKKCRHASQLDTYNYIYLRKFLLAHRKEGKTENMLFAALTRCGHSRAWGIMFNTRNKSGIVPRTRMCYSLFIWHFVNKYVKLFHMRVCKNLKFNMSRNGRVYFYFFKSTKNSSVKSILEINTWWRLS
jgi:hypothetical protein